MADGLPKNWETERALLGGVLLDPRQLPELVEDVDAQDFARPAHAALWELCIQIRGQTGTCDIVTVLDELEKRQDWDAYGGPSYVVALPQACPTTEHLAVYARRIREHATRRRLILAAQAVIERATQGEEDFTTLLDGAEQSIFAVTRLARTADWVEAEPLIGQQLAAIQERCERAERGEQLPGVTTGFVDLDQILAGLGRDKLYILAARPAMGKTALALNVALSAALRGGVGVGIFSLEMGAGELAERLLCAHGRVDASQVRVGRVDPRDGWRRLVEAGDAVAQAQLYIDETPGLSIVQLRAKARRLRSLCPHLGLIVVDYLQLMEAPAGSGRETREQTISAISRGLKLLAKELHIPVLALSQLNRALELRADKRPMPSDLRESGAIEQDADVILFIYRDEVYNSDSPDKGVAEVIVAKQRAGATGTRRLAFLPQFTLFQNLAQPMDGGGYY